MTGEQLAELRARRIPRMVAVDVFEGLEPGDRAVLNAHLHHFAYTEPLGQCVSCRAQLGGLLGTFRWGIANGHGTCTRCGWPVQAYHRFKEGPVEMFTALLCVHPGDVEVVAKVKDGGA